MPGPPALRILARYAPHPAHGKFSLPSVQSHPVCAQHTQAFLLDFGVSIFFLDFFPRLHPRFFCCSLSHNSHSPPGPHADLVLTRPSTMLPSSCLTSASFIYRSLPASLFDRFGDRRLGRGYFCASACSFLNSTGVVFPSCKGYGELSP